MGCHCLPFVLERNNKMATVANGFEEYHCNYCQADCTSLRVKCAECTDFDLCLQCFACGAEMGKHKRGHDYQLMDGGTFPLFSLDWSAEEEVLLLDAIEQHGFGNCFCLSTETSEHYGDYHISGIVGKATVESFKNKIVDHTSPDQEVLSPTLLHPPEPVEMNAAEQQELGYMPLRDDFEKEYDNEAETLVSGLQFNYDDEDVEIDLKLGIIDMYLRRLRERQHRKNIARQHGLIASKHRIIALRRKYSKEDREFRDATRVFARFKNQREWEEFLNDQLRERELRSRIKDLIRYRKNGITKLAECQEYDEQRLRRERRKENKRKMVVGYDFHNRFCSNFVVLTDGKLSSIQIKSTPLTSKFSLDRAASEEKDEKDCSLSSPTFADEIKNCQTYKLLSSLERQLCASLQMNPGFYLTIKTIILKDNLLRRQGVQVKTRYPPNLDKIHRKHIVHFLKESGWVASS
ncbi:PREDICTED: transcriptional adapter 2-beta-like [Acropora digitifera]|uniref:transcriptional adapter 2-beta-like n=1 Tax=Acropora digitifera TaxID=70779 RepID=UPI00077A0FDE|nr:PREDICTED: transcriptional adapter 2-beta-like [Acropora digitifera]